jgi:hypothetical protein
MQKLYHEGHKGHEGCLFKIKNGRKQNRTSLSSFFVSGFNFLIFFVSFVSFVVQDLFRAERRA